MASQNFVTRPGSQFVQSGTGAVERTVGEKLQDVVCVKDFGAVGDGVTDDTAAFNAAIAYLNTIATPAAIELAGSFVVTGSLSAITSNNKFIIGYGARIIHDGGTLFTFGAGTDNSVVDGGILGLDYLGSATPSSGTCFVEQAGMNRLVLEDIGGDNVNIFLKAGFNGKAGGYFIRNCRLSTYNGTQAVIDHGEGANSQITNLDMTAKGTNRVLDQTTLTGATATAIKFGEGTWDTGIWSGLLVNGYAYGLDINRTYTNKNVSNFRVSNFYFDYCANGMRLKNTATGGGINNMMFTNGWTVGMDGYGVLLEGTVGSHRNILFQSVHGLLAGKNNFRLTSTTMDNVVFSNCTGDFANRLNGTNTGSDQDDFVALSGGFRLINGRFGRTANNIVVAGVPNWQARYGVTAPIASSDYQVINNVLEGLTGGIQNTISNTTVTAGQLFSAKIIDNNIAGGATRPNYATTASLAAPTSNTLQTNNTPFTFKLHIYGGTYTSLQHNGSEISTSGNATLLIEPGDTWNIVYSVAPTIKRIISS